MNSICFDTETTGLHPNGSDPDEILTISIIGRDGSVLLDERFRPTVKTEWPHASAVNGIYPEDVADLPTIETAIPRLREIFAGADEVIGYNVGFDLGFLSAVGVRPREDARIAREMRGMVSEMKDVLEKVEELRNGAADAQHQANQMALMGVANAQQKAGEMTIKNVEEVTARSRKVIDSMVEESKRRIERLSMVTLPDRLFYYCKWMAVILVLIILVHVLWGMLV